MICGTLHVKEMVSLEYGLVNSVEQCLYWQIENKIFLYYLLCMTCGTLDVKEMVSLNMASFLVQNNLCVVKLSIRSFFIIFYVYLWDTVCKGNGFIKYGLVPSVEQSLCWQIEYKIFLYYLLCMIFVTLHVKKMVSLNISLFLVQNNFCAGKFSIRSFFIIY